MTRADRVEPWNVASGQDFPPPRQTRLSDVEERRGWRIALLVLVLPLFGQTMHYMKDLPPLWALSKAFPILSLPLALALLGQRNPPAVFAWLAAFLWLVLVSSFIAVFTFDQSFVLGLTAQVKLLPMLYAFTFLGLLLLLRPTVAELLAAFCWCAALTFAVLVLLWAFAPQSWYVTGYEFGDAPLLSADDRGNRIRMPMYFGLIALFALFRRCLQRPDKLMILLLVVALAVIVGIVKTRAVVLASAATIAVVAFMAAPARWRIAAGGLALLGALVLTRVPYIASAFDTSSASGFDVRWTTIQKALAFLGDSPLRWLFGVGTITSLEPDGLARYFNHFFFLADISWLGIVFEFGLIGAAILLGLLLQTLWLGWTVRRSIDTPFLAGLQDYVLFTVLISGLYSTMTLQPGEIAVIAATFAYCLLIIREQTPRSGSVR